MKAREIRYRRDIDPAESMRIILEERSPLRVELEAAAGQAGMIYRLQQSIGLSVELTPDSFDDRVLFWTEQGQSREVLLGRGGECLTTLVRLERGSTGYLTIEVAAPELKLAREVAQEFVTRLRREKEPEDGARIRVSFWRDSDPFPEWTDRLLDSIYWKDISANYSAPTAREVDRLMAASGTTLGAGRLILWHGKPGTGKTYALRALAREWKPWCDIHYIADPEALLGRAGYLHHLILHERRDDSRWRLLIMEDTGELLTIDARQNVGQALSRLLNTTEGLLGQGLKTLFLITTNEELGKLNPAVTRPGRCLSQVEFSPLTGDESKRWLSAHRIEFGSESALTIADLYSLASGEPRKSTHSLGFTEGGV